MHLRFRFVRHKYLFAFSYDWDLDRVDDFVDFVSSKNRFRFFRYLGGPELTRFYHQEFLCT